jgi:hypothetical protein
MGYNTGTSTLTGSASLNAALIPTFSTIVATKTGFSVNVTNYNNAYIFTPSINIGKIKKGSAVGSNLPLTVSGLTPGQTATITMTVTRTGYNTGTATVTGSSLGVAITPTFSTVVSTGTGVSIRALQHRSSSAYKSDVPFARKLLWNLIY